MFADLRGMKRQHNMIFGYSSRNQVFRNAVFDPIVMNPNFVRSNFGMNNGAMNPFLLIPAFVDEKKVIAIATHDHISLNIAVRIGDVRVLLQDFF
jgi:hypothetical protein